MTNLISWNVNGLRAINKKGFTDWVSKSNPDILCLQETKSWPEQLPPELINLNDYHSFFSQAEKKGYSGVGLYTKTKPLEIKHGIGVKELDTEGRTIWASYSNFELFNIYFPNGKASKDRLQYKLNFYKEFQKLTTKLLKQKKNIIICGDVNTAHTEIDLARPKGNEKNSGFLPIERKWIDDFLASGFIDTFRSLHPEPENYTWWDYKTKARDRNVGWRIDYFFINKLFKKNLKEAYILSNVMGSDHCPIGIKISV